MLATFAEVIAVVVLAILPLTEIEFGPVAVAVKITALLEPGLAKL